MGYLGFTYATNFSTRFSAFRMFGGILLFRRISSIMHKSADFNMDFANLFIYIYIYDGTEKMDWSLAFVHQQVAL